MRIRRIFAPTFLLIGFLALVAFPKPVLAQQPSGEEATIGDTKLRSFAKAYVEVEKIQQSYAPRVKENNDPEKNKEIRQEAKSKIDEALSKEGLTVDSYSQIIQTVNANDELRKKAIEMINDERKKS
jgi:Domain of unknown function (DUF4168)